MREALNIREDVEAMAYLVSGYTMTQQLDKALETNDRLYQSALQSGKSAAGNDLLIGQDYVFAHCSVPLDAERAVVPAGICPSRAAG